MIIVNSYEEIAIKLSNKNIKAYREDSGILCFLISKKAVCSTETALKIIKAFECTKIKYRIINNFN